MPHSTAEILQSSSFQALLRARRRVRITMTLLLLLSYSFFIGGMVLYQDWFASPISADSSIPIGIPATVLVLITMVILQYVYTTVSERYLDVLQKKARKELSL
ncbi:DUF485 domain-containing protein [Cognaticolwellia beringensis]|uniref:DUF485 domain-containing protein n=1 Tax=Cognaticolwellia beringensis TaxID=1967665 RepID=A0A222GA10_9GAMM|nr:DUF485 domain-containing protein [Cognaticolwellia beringensis]ASP48224.1 DUF485 domain-containing protein [Cognaticolwellia beringensis]|tara:strand:- start:45407 stop:45715 length:309 start_codon:yes stop_codon:yes gene_type:complete